MSGHFDLPEMPAGPVMELHGARRRFHVPQGLKPLLEEISVEVMRFQPHNIYKFIAEYLEKKKYGRTDDEEDDEELGGEGYHGGHRHSWEWRRWSWQGSSHLDEPELELFLEEFGIQKAEAEHYATIIQSAFRGHQSRERVKSLILERQLQLQGAQKEVSPEGGEALLNEQQEILGEADEGFGEEEYSHIGAEEIDEEAYEHAEGAPHMQVTSPEKPEHEQQNTPPHGEEHVPMFTDDEEEMEGEIEYDEMMGEL